MLKFFLTEGDIEIRITFYSPVQFIIERQAKRDMPGVSQAIDGAPHIRKTPCQFGWDWGPMLPSIGIWKDLTLEGHSIARLDDVHLRQFLSDSRVNLNIALTVEQLQTAPLAVRVLVTTPEDDILKAEVNVADGVTTIQIPVEDPQLWWPNGYGEQFLYKVEVSLHSGDKVCDQRGYQVGLRTIELQQEDDQWGKSFTFVVNGIPIFAKGSNWIPADSFPTRISDQHFHALIRDTAAVHQNLLRVWGGGFYEDERFYDLCDRYGILVWQDFIFSCSIYPLDERDFLENVRLEITENICRLRHRASLALWCGNNEMEWGWESWGWSKLEFEEEIVAFLENTPSLRSYLSLLRQRQLHSEWKELRSAYEQFFYITLPEWVSQFDPDTAYWTSSPSSNTPFVNVNGVEAGDTHNWEVWHGNKPFTV